MATNTNTVENDLRKLKEFSSSAKVYGFISNLWFHSLRNRYPLEYLLFSQENSNQDYFKNQIKSKLKNQLILKLNKVLKYKLKEEDIADLKTIISTIDNISSKKNI